MIEGQCELYNFFFKFLVLVIVVILVVSMLFKTKRCSLSKFKINKGRQLFETFTKANIIIIKLVTGNASCTKRNF